MKFDLGGIVKFEIDWKAVAFISLAVVLVKLVGKLL